ncbi:helix-turn-helix domain-containing protein [Nocardia xishanensis]
MSPPSEAGNADCDVPGEPRAMRMLLGRRLRRLREELNLTAEQAGSAIHVSASKISRIEGGKVRCRQDDLDALLTLYQVDVEERSEYEVLADRGSQSGWWTNERDWLPKGFDTVLALEPESSVIKCYETRFVPELLQTEEYARAVIEAPFRGVDGDLNCSQATIDRRVALQMRRQRFLSENDPPRLWVVVEEAALRQPIGGEEVWRRQLGHLLNLITDKGTRHIRIQVIRNAACGPAMIPYGFSYLRLNGLGLGDAVCWPTLNTTTVIYNKSELAVYRSAFDRVALKADRVEDAAAFVKALRDGQQLPEPVLAHEKYRHRPTSRDENLRFGGRCVEVDGQA